MILFQEKEREYLDLICSFIVDDIINKVNDDKKKVIAYARISNEDQSHFSIEGQQEEFEEYCFRLNYELTHVYTDEGSLQRILKEKNGNSLKNT